MIFKINFVTLQVNIFKFIGIHSLNNLEMKFIKEIKIFILLLLFLPKINAQINDGERFVYLLKGQVYEDTIKSNFQIVSISPLTENCYISKISNIGNKNFRIVINPLQSNPDYVGPAKVAVQYTDGYKPRYITWNITYLESKITTTDDFVSFNNDDIIGMNPLLNDSHSGSSLEITGLGIVRGGVATFTQDSVFFTPEPDAQEGFIIYGVKDDLGAVANGTIRFIRQSDDFPAVDSSGYTILNTQSQLIAFPSDGFTLSSSPDLGNVTFPVNFVARYQPNKGAEGIESLVFEDSDGNQRKVTITIINKSQNSSSVRDDVFYTPKNTAITFDVFANDLSNNFPIVSYSNDLVLDTMGVFTYTPSSGYSGVKHFNYKVNYGQWQATGNIILYIGDYNPLSTEDYIFKTLKNDPLVLTYNVPVDGYTFSVLNQPLYGTVEVLNDMTVGEGCDIFYSKSTIIYSPDYQYYGNDSFDVEYCIADNPCKVYKIYINIIDAEPDTLCHCNGPDCVWSGDMNGDGRVSVTDILSLGRFIGLTGPARNDVNYPFRSGQESEDWMYNQPNGLNLKHIDANGDGIISEEDIQSIDAYYSNVHQFVPEEVLAIKDYQFDLIPNTTEVDSGDLLILEVSLGSASKPVIDLFGLAFGLNINPSMIDTSSLGMEYLTNSWFSRNGATLHMTKQPKAGVLHTAITNTNSIVEDELEGFRPPGTSGYGVIGQVVMIVEDELEGFRSDDDYIIRRISSDGIQLESVDGERYLLPDTYVDIKVNKNKKAPVPTEDKLIVYPNPVKDKFSVHFNGRNTIKALSIYDQVGTIIEDRENVDMQSIDINTSAYADGIYYVKVVTTMGVITKKVVVLNR